MDGYVSVKLGSKPRDKLCLRFDSRERGCGRRMSRSVIGQRDGRILELTLNTGAFVRIEECYREILQASSIVNIYFAS